MAAAQELDQMVRVLWRGLIEGKEKNGENKQGALEWRDGLGFYLPCSSLP
jgi:hypothetical protein